VPVSATIHVVGDLGDSGAPTQLRAIIGAAVPGDTILVPPGTITLLLGHLVIDKDLTIIGAGRHFTRLDGGGTTRVISVTAAAHVAIASLVIRNGQPATVPFIGGGINNQGVLDLVEVVVEDCASEGGGGIWNDSGAIITMQAVTVQRNSTYGVTASGAGMTNWGTATIAQSTFRDNFTTGASGSAQGGAIQSAGVLSLTNTTISGNYAGGNYGGGLHLIPSATSLALVNVTITNNESGNFGGGLGIGGPAVPVTMVNTIIAGNRVRGTSAHHDCSGTITSQGHNLIGDTTGCTLAGDLTGNQLDVDPLLRPLEDNGGPTPTHALPKASPAVDAANTLSAPAIDQRGVARPQQSRRRLPAVSDIGAYEFERR
jgi:hypothetical protein